jgi:alpha-1,3-rhamnosyltransferase
MLNAPATTPPAPETTDEATVSVVVPSYNHAPFIEKTLRSIFAQTLQPREIIVIDDGSRDGSPKIIERVLRDSPVACEFIARENRGLCATLNEGFARCSEHGCYFAYLGSDDLWFPQFLGARVEVLEARPRAVVAYGNAYSIDAEDRIIDCTIDWARYRDGDVRRMLLETLAPLSPTVVYRRAALRAPVWNEAAQLEDYELYLHLSAGGEFAFDPRVLSAWRQHGSNTSSNLSLMLGEKLAAQRRIATQLNLSAVELAEFQSLAQFRSAQEFMRRGEKLKALKLAAGNLRGAQGFGEAGKLIAGFLIPHPLRSRRRARAREQAGKRYGLLLTEMSRQGQGRESKF